MDDLKECIFYFTPPLFSFKKILNNYHVFNECIRKLFSKNKNTKISIFLKFSINEFGELFS